MDGREGQYGLSSVAALLRFNGHCRRRKSLRLINRLAGRHMARGLVEFEETTKVTDLGGRISSQHLRDHIAVDIGEAKIAAGVTINQACVVDAHQVQDRGVVIVDVYWI